MQGISVLTTGLAFTQDNIIAHYYTCQGSRRGGVVDIIPNPSKWMMALLTLIVDTTILSCTGQVGDRGAAVHLACETQTQTHTRLTGRGDIDAYFGCFDCVQFSMS
jgi:hypothetical protein